MCNALEELRQEGVEEGRQEGRLEGRQEGRQEGRWEGILEGIRATVRTCRNFNISETDTEIGRASCRERVYVLV